jgi:hypothetical protein
MSTKKSSTKRARGARVCVRGSGLRALSRLPAPAVRCTVERAEQSEAQNKPRRTRTATCLNTHRVRISMHHMGMALCGHPRH